jgi:glucose-6-phosphate isomerase
MITRLNLEGLQAFIPPEKLRQAIQARAGDLAPILQGDFGSLADLGWFSPARWEDDPLVELIERLAQVIRAETQVFVLVGVGGSNRGAQAVIGALGDRRVEVLYAGDNLSAHAMQRTLQRLQGRSTFINVIAKDFNTLEPGIAFRLLRQHLQDTYGSEAAERILVTGSRGAGQLFDLAEMADYTYLPFPEDMGGRWSVLSAVGFLPMAVAGVDLRALIQGAVEAAAELKELPLAENPAVQYAAARNLLAEQGFAMENLATFEPSLNYFARWWSQLFAESEGKDGRGVFPITSSYSEDLHASGQYIQEGRRILFETFLDARFSHPELVIAPSRVVDGFAYLDGERFEELNAVVYQAAYQAHVAGGVPCMQWQCGAPTPAVFGELFYLFMLSCCLSARWIGVDPFGQPGVEAYKKNMYRLLGK